MVLTIISAVIALSILIIFHEFGHFIVAKKSGIKVEEFSLGLGPKIVGIKRGETTYRISLVPFGGYVKMAGESPKDRKGEPYEFSSKPAFIKIAVIVAGPFFNFILAGFFFTIVAFAFGTYSIPTTTVKSSNYSQIEPGDKIIAINGDTVETWESILIKLIGNDSVKCLLQRTNPQINLGDLQEISLIGTDSIKLEPLITPVVGKVIKDGVAWKSGIREGDLITKINGQEIKDWGSLVSIIQQSPEKKTSIEWSRNGVVTEDTLIPAKAQTLDENDKIKDIGMIGVQIKTVRKSLGIRAFKEGFLRTIDTIVITFSFLGKLITGTVSSKALGGPVAIVKFVGESVRWGIDSFLNLIAFLSVQLFILNLMPFPPLDGGQILLITIEKLKRKPISEKTMVLIQNIGFGILLLFMAYVTKNDIIRLIKR